MMEREGDEKPVSHRSQKTFKVEEFKQKEGGGPKRFEKWLRGFFAMICLIVLPNPLLGLFAQVGNETSREGEGLAAWIGSETSVATHEILANFGPAIGAADGLWIASPSAGEWEGVPDYYFTWTRDSALTLATLLPTILPEGYLRPWGTPAFLGHKSFNFSAATGNVYGELLIRSYIEGQRKLQTVLTRSGDLWTGGLNEPKFMADGEAFNEEWGRPQRDGPALRALALIPYAHFLLDRAWPADCEYVRTHLYDPHVIREPGKLIKNDLEEVSGGWWLGGFDLWEETEGHHLFTLLVSLRALQAGAHLASRLSDVGAADFYTAQAKRIGSRLGDFWAPQGYWRATLPSSIQGEPQLAIGAHLRRQRTGLDCALPLAVIHAGERGNSTGQGNASFDAADSRVLASLHQYIESFDGLYKINEGKPWTEGWAVGRYAEDLYNGVGKSRGNPWFICTFSVAHVLFLAQTSFAQSRRIPASLIESPIWADLVTPAFWDEWISPRHPTHDLIPGSKGFRKHIERLGEVADRFMEVGRQYSEEDGGMSEEIHRSDGSQVGARDLTWSYASFLGAARAREVAREAVALL